MNGQLDENKQFNNDYNIWKNFKSVQTHMDILLEKYPDLAVVIESRVDPNTESELYGLNANDSRVYVFKDGQGIDDYHRLILEGETQSIKTFDSNAHNTYTKNDLSFDVDNYSGDARNPSVQAISEITKFVERMVGIFGATREATTDQKWIQISDEIDLENELSIDIADNSNGLELD